MPEHGNARGLGTAGAKDNRNSPSVPDTEVAEDRDQGDLAHRLAQLDRWREAVAALDLAPAQARALRIAVLRERSFHAGTRAL